MSSQVARDWRLLTALMSGLVIGGPSRASSAQTPRQGTEQSWECGTPDVDRETASLIDSSMRARGPLPDTRTWTIPVAFHVLHSGPDGDIADSRIGQQIGSMNCAFKGTGFSFRLLKIDRTDADLWYRSCLSHEGDLKSALAVDPSHVLNLYSCDLLNGSSNIAGTARYPWEFLEDSVMHGALLSHMIVVGSTLPNYNERGHSVVHEVGHYLGLWHTFQGGCEDGDSVADTPAQAFAVRDCRAGSNDTCPAPGLDDTLNLMNYGTDCRDHFTSGQAERMRAVVASQKPSL